MPFGFRFPSITRRAGFQRGLNAQRHRGKNFNFNSGGIAGPFLVLSSTFPRNFRGPVGSRINVQVAQLFVDTDLTPVLDFLHLFSGRRLSHAAGSSAGIANARALGRTLHIDGVVDGFLIVQNDGAVLLSQEVAPFGARNFSTQLNNDLIQIAEAYVFAYLDVQVQFAFLDDAVGRLMPG